MKKDKILHFIACAIITLIAAGIALLFGVEMLPCIVLSTLCAAVAGIVKEYADSLAYGNFWSWGDLLADGLGICLAMIIIIAVYLIFNL